MKKSHVVSHVKRMVDWDQEPSLSSDDIDYLVDQARTHDTNGYVVEDVEAWEANTYYDVGTTVVNSNNRSFVCTVEGLSGATEVTYDKNHVGNYDDGTIEWSYVGTVYWTPTYSLTRALYEAWGLKAAKAASMVSFTSDGARFDRDQYIKNCETMQRKYPILGSSRSASRHSARRYPMILEVRVDD